ncbi:hypothetical protein NCAS_0A09260 [Naumovozyma castellii]|uniref:Anaphase-promoting complex subunit 4 WD40 domain-containing protein n=1 Tax=Naumovozyma castellii TaxID=27288 RepID=G0V7N6_NAUCA|nr:hypothetical protein NCAS_0A09260 [Naumovozyma castellii CBS 4309]CCC67484.1 hypothetical protein NCAS_0A09260 [Naumovozyma castellii CBS 4309]
MSETVIKQQYQIPPPDEEEELLAKFVFGDATDFQNSLANFDLDFLNEDNDVTQEINGHKLDGLDNEDEAMDQVNDDQLFFVDEGDEVEPVHDEDAMEIDDEEQETTTSEEESDYDDEVAWIDSDDEKLSISVKETNRTKKLRTSYQELSLNGKNYVRRLRSQFEKIYPKPKWVDDLSSDEDTNDSSDDENEDGLEHVIDGDINALSKVLKSTFNYKDTTQSKLLPSKKLDILRLKDANISHPSQSAIQSMSFHPTKPLLITGGYDRTLRVYHIDGKTNHLVTSLHLKGTPIQTCSFYVSPSDEEHKIFTGGRRRYMHSWDLSPTTSSSSSSAYSSQVARVEKISRLYGHEQTQRSFEKFKIAHFYNFNTDMAHGVILLQGNNGWINVLHATTGVWLTGCKIEGTIVDFCVDYKPLSGKKFQTILIATNTYGEIWEFILNKENGKILRKWKDEGGVGITTIQVGGGTNSSSFFPANAMTKVKSNRWLAIGSESGFVNVYDRKNLGTGPVATLDQLTTTISSLQFSPDGQILCMASRAIKDALRLVHLPSCTVFSNWPTSGTPLGKVTSVAFSPRGEMIAVGNEQGKVRLWRLNHY